MKRPPATSSDWKTEPLSEHHARLDLDLHFTHQETAQIKQGLIPEEMEDTRFV